MKNNHTQGGFIPPQAIDLEEKILGAIMQDKEAITDIAEILNADAFYQESHKMIFKAITKLFNDNDPIDILTVANALKEAGNLEICGGNYAVAKLTMGVSSGENIEMHSRIVQQCYIRREVIRSSQELIKSAYADDVDIFEILTKSEHEKDQLMQGLIRKKEVSNEELMKATLVQMEKTAGKNGISGVPSGFSDVDKLTGGWQNSDLIIVAGRPGMGKTAWALQNGLNAAIDFSKPGAFFSLEMSAPQLMKRQLSIICDVPLVKFIKNDLQEWDYAAIGAKQGVIGDAPIFWDDTPSLNVLEFKAKARRLKKKQKIEWIIIDYLQLMDGKITINTPREQEIGNISRTLKQIAKELDIPVIALSQLSRAVESRPGINGKRPMLSDLRESGSIEQDADIVVFLYRPEYYGIDEDEAGNSTEGLAEVIIAKHRNGSTDEIPVSFNKSTTGFSDYIPSHIETTNLSLVQPPPEAFRETVLKPSNMFDTNNEKPPF